MVIINYWTPEDFVSETDEPTMTLAGIVNDEFDICDDPELINECIGNSDFEPTPGNQYELILDRADDCSSSDFGPCDAFVLRSFKRFDFDGERMYIKREIIN